MSVDSIGYPLPVMKNGYACLNAGEIELARKNIDPARPKVAPEPRAAAAPSPEAQAPEAKVQVPQTNAAVEPGRVLNYSADAVRRETVATGLILSLSA